MRTHLRARLSGKRADAPLRVWGTSLTARPFLLTRPEHGPGNSARSPGDLIGRPLRSRFKIARQPEAVPLITQPRVAPVRGTAALP